MTGVVLPERSRTNLTNGRCQLPRLIVPYFHMFVTKIFKNPEKFLGRLLYLVKVADKLKTAQRVNKVPRRAVLRLGCCYALLLRILDMPISPTIPVRRDAIVPGSGTMHPPNIKLPFPSLNRKNLSSIAQIRGLVPYRSCSS
jgi:hypothetical protein